MARVAITESYLEDIADAIREKTGLSEETYTPSEMAPAIMTISGSGGITPTGSISITENGTHNVTAYASANVNVPNSYSVSDEGKVVDNGALVSQTTHADVTPTTSDQTIDTTTNNSIKVKGDADLVAGNIKKDVEIFGVTGSYEGGGGSLGGLANMVDVTNIDYEFGYMLSQMKKGNTAGGTVTYSSNFPNTESLLLSTGLTEIHGFMFVNPATDIPTGTGSSTVNKTFFAFVKQDQTWDFCGFYSNNVSRSYNNANGTAINSAPINGTLRISGGDIYYTGRYNKNANYQLLAANTLYEWLAW